MISEFMRELLGANQAVTGILIFVAALVVFLGSIFLLLATNLGKKLGFLVTGAGMSGWVAINSVLFLLYAPRGPRQADITGLSAFELRIYPLMWLSISLILFFMFMVALSRFEAEQNKTMR